MVSIHSTVTLFSFKSGLYENKVVHSASHLTLTPTGLYVDTHPETLQSNAERDTIASPDVLATLHITLSDADIVLYPVEDGDMTAHTLLSKLSTDELVQRKLVGNGIRLVVSISGERLTLSTGDPNSERVKVKHLDGFTPKEGCSIGLIKVSIR